MTQVLITRSKLDGLASTIAAKSGATLPLTIAQMDSAVQGIETGVDTSSDTVDAAHLLDGYTAHDANGDAITGEYVPASPTLETVAKSYTPSETQQTETITPSTGYDGIAEVDVTVGAISSSYVGSGVTRHTSTDLTASGATVTAPAGYYASSASKSVASGTEGTPTASKGTVSNHAISVTPSVTNAAGYIAGGTHSGTAVSVAASELVSGTATISGSGTTDVTNYATASVAAGGATASATKGSVSNHSISVTPSVTRTAGWVTAGSANGTAVTVSASELVSGNKSITSNGTNIDVANYATVSVDVSGSGYTLTTIVPQQTVTPNSSRQASLSNFAAAGLVEGESYLVTLDGDEYIETCGVLWGNNCVIGDQAIIFGTSDIQLPFAIDWVSASDNVLVTLDTNQHTVKVEHIELGSGATVLTTKTITANGTYAASSDSADGYSSVTVSVSGGTPRTSADLTVSGATVTAPAGVYASDASKSVASMTLPTAASSTSSGTSKATITPGSSAQYINIPTGFNDTAMYYTIAAASGGSAQTATGTFTGNGTREVSFSCNFEPDVVYWNSDPGTSASSGTVAGIIVRDMMAANRYRNNTTTNSHYAVPGATGMNTAGSSYSHRATYNSTSNQVTLYCFSNNARSLFTNGRSYTFKCVKWTS